MWWKGHSNVYDCNDPPHIKKKKNQHIKADTFCSWIVVTAVSPYTNAGCTLREEVWGPMLLRLLRTQSCCYSCARIISRCGSRCKARIGGGWFLLKTRFLFLGIPKSHNRCMRGFMAGLPNSFWTKNGLENFKNFKIRPAAIKWKHRKKVRGPELLRI